MSRQPADLTALSYVVDSIGKLFSDSKTRHTWTFEVEGETQTVVVIASWNSSKFVVEVNGYERFHQVVSGVFVYSFKFRERYFRISSRGEDLTLLIDTIPFDAYTAKAKATQAALLKSYKHHHPPTVVPVVSEEGEAFMGDLGKRLGKKPDDYIEQADEDFFASPVVVHSFVPETLTVIPNLLEISECEVKLRPRLSADDLVVDDDHQKVTQPVCVPVLSATPSVQPVSVPVLSDPVTPKSQISPDNLVNPFSAFDELAVHQPAAHSPVNPFI